MTKSILSSQYYKSSLTPAEERLELSPPPDNLQFSLLEIRDYYAGLVEKYALLAEAAKTKLAHAESLLESWEHKENDRNIKLEFNAFNGNGDLEKIASLGQNWSTSEVALKIDRSVEWCNNQRYQNPDRLVENVHYLKDDKGFIRWTTSGIKILIAIGKNSVNIPEDVTPTKEIAKSMGVSTKWISRARIKYSEWFVSGTHFYHHSRKGFLWTDKGIELLAKIQSDRESFDANFYNTLNQNGVKANKFQSKADIKIIPPYQELPLATAVAKVLKDNAGSILTLDYIVAMLYGKVEGEALKIVKNRLVKTISLGKKRGKWDSVPNETGCYTWDWQLIVKKRRQKRG